jgi:hypothetical protein
VWRYILGIVSQTHPVPDRRDALGPGVRHVREDVRHRVALARHRPPPQEAEGGRDYAAVARQLKNARSLGTGTDKGGGAQP